jgi:hypothetical protein
MSDNRTIEFLKGLVLGGVVGAVVALLYAPIIVCAEEWERNPGRDQ